MKVIKKKPVFKEFSIRVKEETFKKLEREAEKHGISRNAIVAAVLENVFKDDKNFTIEVLK